MKNLNQKKCVPCEAGVPTLTPEEVSKLSAQIDPQWSVDDSKKIIREFTFNSFAQALAFLNKVGELAENEGHHPDLTLHNYKYLTVTLSTHAIDGLSENDFILASKIDTLAQ